MKTTAFAEWLAQTRERRGLSQNQLALTAGVDPSTVNKLEAGQIELPRKSTLRKLAAPLQVTEAEIFRAAGLRSETPTVERELSDEEWGLVELYRGVSPERRELYKKLMENAVEIFDKEPDPETVPLVD
jgi:transcriptional regulator with XRE-family HTH domain